jgi:hypothetical protein
MKYQSKSVMTASYTRMISMKLRFYKNENDWLIVASVHIHYKEQRGNCIYLVITSECKKN